MVLLILIRTRNIVTRRVIRPRIISGFTKKLKAILGHFSYSPTKRKVPDPRNHHKERRRKVVCDYVEVHFTGKDQL